MGLIRNSTYIIIIIIVIKCNNIEETHVYHIQNQQKLEPDPVIEVIVEVGDRSKRINYNMT